MTRSLITGGAGFLGSHVVHHCMRLGHDIVVLDDLSGGFRKNVPEGVAFIPASVTDPETIERLFESYRFDYVYHLAAYAAEGLSHFIRRFNYTNNLIGSVNLVNAAVKQGVKCLVFTSSIAVYGSIAPPMRESDTPHPEDPYGISKYAVEMDLAAAHELFGLNYIVFRPHNIYGERQNIGDRYRNVIGIFMNQVMRGEKMTIFGDGLQTRAFSHVDDVAPLIAASAEMPALYNEVFNAGADQPHTVIEVAELVAKAFGCAPQIEFLPPRVEAQHAFATHQKLRAAFGQASAPVPLEAGITRMAEWAKHEGARATPVFAQVEVHEKMPPSWRGLLDGR